MLKRKISQTLLQWKQLPNHNPLVVKGCRQCGKTYSVLAFAHEHYSHVVYLNFFENPSLCKIFDGSLEVDTLTMMMSAVLGDKATFKPYETVIILDEIQICPQARTALKFFKLDGRYDIIATGSLLGVNGYREAVSSIPVGYETVIDMKPLDFEEFLWANGIQDDVIDFLGNCLHQCIVIPAALHQRMRDLLLQYVVVGGMPEIVNLFIQTKNLHTVLTHQRSLISAYKDDMVKYASNSDKSKIRECFESIPRQLGKDNKKFQYAMIKKGARSSEYASRLQWIEDAGIICRAYNLSITELPLDGNSIADSFKVYMADTGLFVSMLEDGTQQDILQGNLLGYKGAIFENLVADFFSKMGRKLYYFQKNSGLQIDFVIRYKGECVPVEVKAKSGNIKSTKTILAHPEKYHVRHAIKLGDYNLGGTDQILTLPLYMGFLLTDI